MGEGDIESCKAGANESMIHENADAERMVRFTTVLSCVVFTIEIPSRPYRIPAGESAFSYGLAYTILSLTLGWWAFPWGPQRTWEALESNRTGRPILSESTS